MSVASSASEPVPKKLASEVTRIRNGNSDSRIESAMWLAIAHPSCRRKRPEAIFATARRVLKRGTRLRGRKGGGEARRPSKLPPRRKGFGIHILKVGGAHLLLPPLGEAEWRGGPTGGGASPRRFVDDKARLPMGALAQPPHHPRRPRASPSHPPPLPLSASRLRRAGGGRSAKPTWV